MALLRTVKSPDDQARSGQVRFWPGRATGPACSRIGTSTIGGSSRLHTRGIPLAMGTATRRIMHAAAPFLPNPFTPGDIIELVHGKQVAIGPFANHSLLGRPFGLRRLRAFGRGWRPTLILFRRHPRPWKERRSFRASTACAAKAIDAMLMEGSSLGRLEESAGFPTESEIEQRNCDRLWHHRLSITRPMEGCVLFLTLIQLGDPPPRYLLSLRFETSALNDDDDDDDDDDERHRRGRALTCGRSAD